MTTRLHREGKTIIPVAFLLIGGIMAVAYAFGPLWLTAILGLAGLVLFGLILNFFRNPEIPVETNAQHILAPCDGKVVVIEEVNDDVYFNKPMVQVSIFMSPLNVHVNRNPIGGLVKFFKYFPGKFLVAFDPKSSEVNERTYAVVENEHFTVGYKQVAGYVARRIRWYIKEGDKVEQGAEYGFIKFGSRIDILIPLDAKIKVKLGDIALAGITTLAEK